jgi:UDP:flavonoid glycosyltransferase YjiC (YdhE family)
MVVPFAADQPYWGERTRALGVGVAPIPVKALTVDNLAAAITRLTADAEMRSRAAALGAKLRQEDGLGAAVKIVRGIIPP